MNFKEVMENWHLHSTLIVALNIIDSINSTRKIDIKKLTKPTTIPKVAIQINTHDTNYQF